MAKKLFNIPKNSPYAEEWKKLEKRVQESKLGSTLEWLDDLERQGKLYKNEFVGAHTLSLDMYNDSRLSKEEAFNLAVLNEVVTMHDDNLVGKNKNGNGYIARIFQLMCRDMGRFAEIEPLPVREQMSIPVPVELPKTKKPHWKFPSKEELLKNIEKYKDLLFPEDLVELRILEYERQVSAWKDMPFAIPRYEGRKDKSVSYEKSVVIKWIHTQFESEGYRKYMGRLQPKNKK